jgi:hypothetical protein
VQICDPSGVVLVGRLSLWGAMIRVARLLLLLALLANGRIRFGNVAAAESMSSANEKYLRCSGFSF